MILRTLILGAVLVLIIFLMKGHIGPPPKKVLKSEPIAIYNITTIYYVGNFFLTAICVNDQLKWKHESSQDNDCHRDNGEGFLSFAAGPYLSILKTGGNDDTKTPMAAPLIGTTSAAPSSINNP